MIDPALSVERHRRRPPDGYVQTVAFEIEDNRIRTIYSVRNPYKLKHLTPA